MTTITAIPTKMSFGLSVRAFQPSACPRYCGTKSAASAITIR
jgi:hypothetical protein